MKKPIFLVAVSLLLSMPLCAGGVFLALNGTMPGFTPPKNESADALSVTLDKLYKANEAGDVDADLIAAAQMGDMESIAQLMKQEGANINYSEPETGNSALLYAVMFKHMDVIDQLLSLGAFINIRNNDNLTPLMYACENGLLEPVEILLARGSNINLKAGGTRKGSTPIILAARGGHIKVVQTLLKYQVNPNSTTIDGKTALMFAAQHGYVDTAEVLIKSGAEVNSRDKASYTPLMLAAEKGHLEMVKLLVKYGADVKLVRTPGSYDTASYLATVAGNIYISQYLVTIRD